jgi:LmbE family N-acetylglucosaminyl deacetylase
MPDFDIKHFSSGMIVIVAPHMDDEALACGGLISQLPYKNRIHIIYATDGMKSPAPIIVGRDEISPNLGKIRMQESVEAMRLLGITQQNLHFFCLPEAQLQKNISVLRDMLREKIMSIMPEHIFVPFRFDRHLDHLAINHVVTSDIEHGIFEAQLIEYFVYYRWRLMPKRDIRKYIHPPYLFKLDIANVSKQKRLALDSFKSQTTIYYPWQTRPILTPTLLEAESNNPEYFLIAPLSAAGTTVFSGFHLWIRLVHRLEPGLVRWKYLIGSFIKRMVRNRVRQSN